MLYVQQSLGPDEQIIFGARFHLIYTIKAVSWIIFGAVLGLLIAGGAIFLDVHGEVNQQYQDLPTDLYWQAFNRAVDDREGYFKILWALNPILRLSMLAMFLLGILFFANMMLTRATTEIAVTTERLIYKRGLIARHVGEISVDRVEGVTVTQGIMGRILGYGRVIIRGMGVGEVTLPQIAEPIEFRRAVQEAKSIQEKGGFQGGDSF